MEDFGIFYAYLVNFPAFWYILWLPIWYIFPRFGSFYPFWYVVPRKIWHP
jgi:hypothetical protein